jgi:hypothetical protein
MFAAVQKLLSKIENLHVPRPYFCAAMKGPGGILILLCLLTASVDAQNPALWGANYTTVNNALVNPSSVVNSKSYLEVVPFSVYANARNSYLYVPGSDFQRKTQDRADKDVHNIYAQGDATLISFVQMYQKWAFGLINRSRNMATFRRIPVQVAKFGFEGLNYPPQHNQQFEHENFFGRGMAWGEIGGYAGRIFYQSGEDLIYIGGALKVLNGLGYAGINFENISYVADTQNLRIYNFDGNYAIATPGWGKGYGGSMDVGITYIRSLESVGHHVPHSLKSICKTVDYKYKLGASLLDFGLIRFFQDAARRKVNEQTFDWNDYSGFPVTSLSRFDFAATQKMMQSGASFESDTAFNAWMPLTLSLQGDYNFETGFFANAVLMAPIPVGMHGARRVLSLHSGIRYEQSWWEVGVPLSVFLIRSPSVGLYARIGPLEVGSNNFLPFLFRRDFYDGNLYAGLKINIMQSPECRQFRKSQKQLIHGIKVFRLFRKKDNSQKNQ